MKRNFLYSLLILTILSCNLKKSDKTVIEDFHCLHSEDSLINIEGNLTLDSKGIPLVDFADTIYNGKLKIIDKEFYKSIHSNYDAFLSLKNFEECKFSISIYGHYVLPIDTTNWIHKRRNFHAHTMSFGY